MRLFEFQSQQLSDQEALDIRRTKCDMIRHVRLFRGVKKVPFGYNDRGGVVPFIGTIRTDRKPLHSSEEEHAVFDALMAAAGWPHRKSNTLSTTITRDQTRDYGNNTFRVMPFDGATYLYSTQHNDLMSVPDSILADWWDRHPNAEVSDCLPLVLPELKETWQEWVDKLELKYTDNPETIIGAAGEVLVHGTYYLGT